MFVSQVSFLAYAFGGGVGHQLNFQPRYKGRDLAFMHSHMVEKGLTMEHFDSVLRHFCQTLRQLNMPQVGFSSQMTTCRYFCQNLRQLNMPLLGFPSQTATCHTSAKPTPAHHPSGRVSQSGDHMPYRMTGNIVLHPTQLIVTKVGFVHS